MDVSEPETVTPSSSEPQTPQSAIEDPRLANVQSQDSLVTPTGSPVSSP